ncbi:MAG: ROK family protein [Rhodoferax sp.]
MNDSSPLPASTQAPATPANDAGAGLPPGFVWPGVDGCVACVDVGGTKVAVSLLDALGVRARRTEPTATQGAPDALGQQIVRLIDACAAQAGVAPDRIARVGVSSCGPFVLRDGGVELAAPNICGGLAGPARGLPNDWTSAALEAPLRQRFADVRVANDGIGALQAERRWGALRDAAGRPLDHCAYVTWSTGIGTGVCVDGRVLRGKNGNAGHAGHIFVSDDATALCGCGNRGDVESLIAGNAIGRRLGDQGYADAAALFAAADAGDARAQALIDDLCRVMGRMLYALIATLDLERISLGGSVYWHHRDALLPRLRAAVAAHLPPLTQGCTLVSAGLGLRVGDFGALALVV